MAGDENYVLKRLPSENFTGIASQSPTVEPEAGRKGITRDEADLAHFGKRQQFKRNFGMVSIIGLTCTLMITWEGLLITFQGGFTNGGPAGLVGSYFFAWAGTMLQTLVMAEMGSMIPLAGGQYNWVSILAPKSSRRFLSYFTGWITVIAWQVCTASTVLLSGTLIQGLAVMNHTSFVPKRWQATLIFYAVTALALFVNTYLARLLPKIEAIVLTIHIVGFFGILIPLVYISPKTSTKEVFQTFLNLGEWPTKGLSFFVGATTTVFSFIGVDGASHMAEEIENASRVIPHAMIITVLINGALGFGMLMATLFCLGNIDDAVSTPTGFPFMEIFESATNSVGGATAMACVVTVTIIFTTIGFFATSSRMLWAFAREKGVPGSSYLSKVESRSSLPLWAIAFTVVVNLLLALINIGSTTVFNAFTGISVAGFYTSFICAAGVMLHKRLHTPDSGFRWGPFKLGRAGIPVLVLSIAYSAIAVFFSFFPPTSTVTPATMNWSVVIFGGCVIFCIVFWFVHARHHYTGPIAELRPEREERNEDE